MKFSIEKLVAIGVTVLTIVGGWVISVEVRFSQQQAIENVQDRVTHLENLLVPLIVEYQIQSRLAERMPQPIAVPEDKPLPYPSTQPRNAESGAGQARQQIEKSARQEVFKYRQ